MNKVTQSRLTEIVSEISNGIAPKMTKDEGDCISIRRVSICGVFYPSIIIQIKN